MSLPWANPCMSWGECGLVASDIGHFLPRVPTNPALCTTTLDEDDVIVVQGNPNVKRYNPAPVVIDSNNSVVADEPPKDASNKSPLRIVDSGACPPYKVEYFERELFEHDPGEARRNAVIQTLRIMGVKVYVIEQMSIKNTRDLVQQVRSVVKWTREESHSSSSSDSAVSGIGPQRCLLYEDMNGRLFNLVFTAVMRGPAVKWREYRDAFSTSRAIGALVLLVRSFPCLLYKETTENVRPLYFCILIGLVLAEETSFSEINASIFVRCTPSISSHMLDCTFRSDVPRHVILLALALATATTGVIHTALLTIGMVGACWLILVNLGARTWHFLQLRGLRYEGLGQVRVASYSAWATGFCLPYLSHRSTSLGGKQSVEHVIGSAICVAFVMLVSDFSSFTQYIVVGSEARHQDVVNILLGCWWLVSLLCSLLLVRNSRNESGEVPDGEHLLVRDDLSPLGCKVPSLPDYEVDPLQSMQPQQLHWECILSILLACLIGSAWALVSFSQWGKDVYEQILQGN